MKRNLLSFIFQAYGPLLVQKIRHKHTLARNHFSKMSTMENYFKNVPSPLLDDQEEEEEATVLESNSVSTMTD